MAAPMNQPFLQTQSLPAWTKPNGVQQRKLAQQILDPSLSSESTISSEEETDCESDRGSCTPLRDDRSRFAAYMARKGMTKSAFQQRFGADGTLPLQFEPCCFRNRPDLRTTDPMAIPSKTNGYQGWDEDEEDCRCGNDCGFFQDDGLAIPGQEQSLDEMIFDLEI